MAADAGHGTALVTPVEEAGARNVRLCGALPSVSLGPPALAGRPPAGILDRMSDVTHILSALKAGDPSAAGRLLPLVYDELRRLASQRLAQEQPGQTLDATGLVHEAYLRLVGAGEGQRWDGRGHFFA